MWWAFASRLILVAGDLDVYARYGLHLGTEDCL